MSENGIQVLEKGLDFAPIQRKIKKPELRKDFEGFCRRTRTKWNFRDEPSQDFSVVPAFARTSSWKLFKENQYSLRYSNISQEEWRAVRS